MCVLCHRRLCGVRPGYHLHSGQAERQLCDMKAAVNVAYWSKDDFKLNPVIAGEILARAHARAGDAAIMRGYLGKSEAFEDAIGKYGVAYAKQAERDYGVFVSACKTGLLKVQMDE